MPFSLDAPVMIMLPHLITTISSNLSSMISIASNCLPAAATPAVRDQQDARKIGYEQNIIRLASSLSQLNQLIFFFPFRDESFHLEMMKQ